MTQRFVYWFKDISIDDVPLVGGKNASLGEMYRELSPKGIQIPNGFAISAEAYRYTIEKANIIGPITQLLRGLDTTNLTDLRNRGQRIRDFIRSAALPEELEEEIRHAYRHLCTRYGDNTDVAVRSSATAEDLPNASFAGQQDSFLNIRGERELITACRNCFASLFTDRAISYRVDKGFDHLSVALSVCVQKMVRSDLACAGVMFSIDPETGFKDAVAINAVYGLGETIVQGHVTPDEYYVFKPTLRRGFRSIISKVLGSKAAKAVYGNRYDSPVEVVPVPPSERQYFVLENDEILTLARWACHIEEYYSRRSDRFMPMDIEWAKDGISEELYIVQARPETVISTRNTNMISQYALCEKGKILVQGRSVGQMIGSGPANVIRSPKHIENFQPGQVLVTDNTDPDWEPIMKIAAAIVTNRGGRTSHAAIVSRELGIPCVVATINATEKIVSGTPVTVSCAEGEDGYVYDGLLKFEKKQLNLDSIPQTKTKVMMNVGTPEHAFSYSFLPHDGVGLARLEFIISSAIQIHPMALANFTSIEDEELFWQIEKLTHGYADKKEYFIEKLAEGVGKIAAAFYPKPVIVRMSDFKSNEYANLIGGYLFEPKEENPMIGWRGACRYYHENYRAGFLLECLAMRRVREEYGLTNIRLMVPFCRTPQEAKKVIAVMAEAGLRQGENGLAIYGMCELPSNVLLAEEFLQIFDGFSIGTNDLTQLTLGLDRDSSLISTIFDERNPAVQRLVQKVIATARRMGKYCGICGDAPSTYPGYLRLLIEAGIDSISLTPDVVAPSRLMVAAMEAGMAANHALETAAEVSS